MVFIVKKSLDKSRRVLRRDSLLDCENIFISSRVNDKDVIFRVRDMHCFGASVSVKERLVSGELNALRKLSILYNGREIGFFESGRVVHSSKDGENLVLGIKFGGSEGRPKRSLTEHVKSRRGDERFLSSRSVRPTLTFANEINLNDQVVGNIKNISKSGACVEVSFRNRLLFRKSGERSGELYFPLCGSGTFLFEILEVTKSEACLLVHIRFTSISADLLHKMMRYLLNFSEDDSVSIIRQFTKIGVSRKGIKDTLTIRLASSEEEVEAVFRLRKIAYTKSGKVKNEESWVNYTDASDSKAYIFIAETKGAVVGSIRACYIGNSYGGFELEQSIELPSWLDRERCVEISRLCVDPEWQKSDIALGLVERVCELCVKMGIVGVVTSASGKLIKRYQTMGFKKVGVTFELKTLGGVSHELLYLSLKDACLARGVNIFVWYHVYGKIFDYLEKNGLLSINEIGFFKRQIIRALRFFRKG